MENVTLTQVQYTFKEKFFQIEPEGRVRRYQYLVRSLVPGFLLFLCMIPLGILGAIWIGLLGVKIMAIVSFLLYWYVYYIFYQIALTNATKRCHDFWNDGKNAKLIVQLSFATGILGIAFLMFQTLWILPGIDYSSIIALGSSWGDAAGLDNVKSMMETAQPSYLRIFSILQQVIGVISFIMWIFLSFRPGVKGDNQYGKDPINTKVAFLG